MNNMITDRDSMRRYRTELPNLIDDMDLSVYAFRLYMRLKRVAGDNGKCFYTTQQLAEQCRMSTGSISKAKQELVDADLIRIERGDKWARDNITIVDLWPANFAHFAQETTENAYSPHEHENDSSVHHMNTPVHDMNATVHHMNTKEEPIKKEPTKESEAQAPARPPVLRSRNCDSLPSSKIRFTSPHVDNSKFSLDTGYIEPGNGLTAVEVYYERFDVAQKAARLNAIKEDDLVMHCPDLDKLRDVVTAYSQTTYQPGNLRLILDWYRGGIPEKHSSPGGKKKQKGIDKFWEIANRQREAAV